MSELILRFLIVGALAFGGGQAALPLVERLAIGDMGWLTPAQFAVGVGLAYATPGPVLILAAFVGYHVAGMAGALAATVGVFAIPVAPAWLAAQLVADFREAPWFQVLGRYAAAAAIGLLGVTLVALAQPLVMAHPLLLFGAVAVFVVERHGVHPAALVMVAALLGGLAPMLGWQP